MWKAGRNRHGNITVYSKGKREKRIYKEYGLKESCLGYSSKKLIVEKWEYTGYRNSALANCKYLNGFGSLRLIPNNKMKINDKIVIGLLKKEEGIWPMYFSNLKNLLPGTELFNLNGKYGKSGGISWLLIGFTKEKKALIKLPSEKLIIISKDSFCQTGSVQKPFLSGDLKRCKKTKGGVPLEQVLQLGPLEAN